MRIRWRGLELPSKVVCDQSSLTESFGRFYVEPFERGFGVTIGNSLRRVLLSSLEGNAVTRMKIRGAQMEFAVIPGILEDVTEICLNVKSLIVRAHDERPDRQHVLRISKVHTKDEEPYEVLASDILTDGLVDIINPDLRIATLTGDVNFEVEMVVESGRGYQSVADQDLFRDRNEEVGVIPLDASFSPVVKVKYSVEETRVGQKTNYDRLVLEITTDRSVDPQMALIEAAKILRKHLSPFVMYDHLGGSIFNRSKSVASSLDPALEVALSKNIADLNLSVRAANCLGPMGANLTTIRELVVMTDERLLGVRNLGETSLQEIKEKLSSLGLKLGMNLEAGDA